MAKPIQLTMRSVTLESDQDLPEDERSVFYVMPISTTDKAALFEKYGLRPSEQQSNAYMLEVVRRTLRGWERFGAAQFRTETIGRREFASEDSLNCLSLAQLSELFSAAISGVPLSVEQRGKS